MGLARRLWRWLAAAFAAMVILLALLVGLFRLLLPLVPESLEQIEGWASAALGVPVTLGAVDARWRIGGPELVFYDGELWKPDGSGSLFRADSGSVRLSVWALLAQFRLQPDRVILRGVQIDIERSPDGWRVLGQQLARMEEPTVALPRGRLELHDATLSFEDALAGAPPLRLGGARLNFESGSGFLRLDGELELPGTLGGALEFAAQVERTSAIAAPDRWQVYLRGAGLDLSGIAAVSPAVARGVRDGFGELTVWARFEQGLIAEGSLGLALDGVVLRAAPDSPSADFVYDYVGGRVDWLRLAEGWRLSGQQLELARGGRRWPRSRFVMEVLDEGARLSGEADFLRLDDVLPLAHLLPDEGLRQQLLALDPSGELRGMELRYQRDDGHALPRVRAEFTRLGFAAMNDRPGIRGLDGTLQVDPDGGHLEVASEALELDVPSLFRAALPPTALDGTIRWKRAPAAWEVMSDRLLLRNRDLEGTARFELVVPGGDRSPFLDLQAELPRIDMARVSPYLPAGKLPQPLVAWLDRAMLGGVGRDASLSFIGPMRAFPFDREDGDFRASVEVEGVELQYAAAWPPARDVQATVEFYNAGLTARVHGAEVNGYDLGATMVEIADLREGRLSHRGRGSGDLGALVGYLQSAPQLARQLGILGPQLLASGDSSLELEYTLPIRALKETRVNAALEIRQGVFAVDGIAQRLEAIDGALKWGAGGLSGEGLAALLLGRPVRVDVQPAAAAAEGAAATTLLATGRFDAVDLGTGLHPVLSEVLQGSSVYRVTAALPSAGGSDLTLQVESDLDGTAVQLPAPVAKPAESLRPVRLRLSSGPTGPDGRLTLDLDYGETTRGVFELGSRDGRWVPIRGALELGGGDPTLAPGEGLTVGGQADELDLGGWLSLALAGQGGARSSTLLQAVNLRASVFRAFGQRLEDVAVTIDRAERGWSVQLDSARARGRVSVPAAASAEAPVEVRFETLHLVSGDSPGTPADPGRLPAFEIDVGDFRYDQMALGALQLELVPVPNGIEIANLVARAPSFKVEATGEWLLTDFGHRSQMDLSVRSSDVLETLEALAFEGSLSAEEAEIVASLRWPDAPGGRFREQLSGDVQVRVGKGQLLSVRPGAGKVFGLLSVAALPRRLALDFRDVFEKGLGFDEIRGDFTIDAGNAYTNNLVLEGPTADVGIAGRTGLVARDYDQTAVVYANFGSTLPVAGAIAGGPAVGAALLLFSEILKKPLKEMSRTQYRISGTWDDPIVERVEPDAPQRRDATREQAEEAAG